MRTAVIILFLFTTVFSDSFKAMNRPDVILKLQSLLSLVKIENKGVLADRLEKNISRYEAMVIFARIVSHRNTADPVSVIQQELWGKRVQILELLEFFGNDLKEMSVDPRLLKESLQKVAALEYYDSRADLAEYDTWSVLYKKNTPLFDYGIGLIPAERNIVFKGKTRIETQNAELYLAGTDIKRMYLPENTNISLLYTRGRPLLAYLESGTVCFKTAQGRRVEIETAMGKIIGTGDIILSYVSGTMTIAVVSGSAYCERFDESKKYMLHPNETLSFMKSLPGAVESIFYVQGSIEWNKMEELENENCH